MRIALRELELLRTNPKQYWDWRKAQKRGGFARPGYQHMGRLGIYKFHKGAGALEPALDYMRKRFVSYELTNEARQQAALDAMTSYATWHGTASPIVLATQHNARLDLSGSVFCTGQIGRVDLTAGPADYTAVLLEDAPHKWEAQIRIPIIQQAVAQQFGRDPDTVAVAVQRVDGSGLQVHHYDPKALAHAIEEIQEAAQELTKLIAKDG